MADGSTMAKGVVRAAKPLSGLAVKVSSRLVRRSGSKANSPSVSSRSNRFASVVGRSTETMTLSGRTSNWPVPMADTESAVQRYGRSGAGGIDPV